MRKIIVLLSLITVVVIPMKVQAEDYYNGHEGCTYSEISKLKEQVSKVKFSYDYNLDTLMTVTLSNFTTSFYGVDDNNLKYIYTETNKGIISNNKYFDDQSLKITYYANGGICKDEKLLEKTYKLPKYNRHYKDPMCDGIDPNELAVCGKWYPNEVSDVDFFSMVANYKQSLVEFEKNKNTEELEDFNILDLINEYYYYIIASLSIFVIILLFIIKSNKKKRSIV